MGNLAGKRRAETAVRGCGAGGGIPAYMRRGACQSAEGRLRRRPENVFIVGWARASCSLCQRGVYKSTTHDFSPHRPTLAARRGVTACGGLRAISGVVPRLQSATPLAAIKAKAASSRLLCGACHSVYWRRQSRARSCRRGHHAASRAGSSCSLRICSSPCSIACRNSHTP